MTFLECRHSLVLCPGVRGPPRRACASSRRLCTKRPGTGAHGEVPARHDRPAATRPPAGTFREGLSEVPSGELRRGAPVSRARRRVAIAGLARRTRRCVGRGNDNVADRNRAQRAEAGRRDARGVAGAKSTQVGLTVSGHPGPDDANLAPRVAVRQWGCGSRSRVWPLVPRDVVENAFQARSRRRATRGKWGDRRRAVFRARSRIDRECRASCACRARPECH